MNSKTESIFSSLLASSLLVGLPSVLFVFIIVYLSFGIFRKRFSTKDSIPPMVGVYITKCIYSITYYWEKIIPQLRFVRVTHDFIVFQCLSVVFTLKLIDHLQDGPKSIRELSKLTNVPEKNLHKLLRALTMEGFFTYFELTGKYSFNKSFKSKMDPTLEQISSVILENSKISSGELSTSPLKTSISTSGMKTYFETKDSFFLNHNEFDDLVEDEDTFDNIEEYCNGASMVDENNINCILSMMNYPKFIESWQKLKECVQSSMVPGFQIKHGAAFFQYIDEKELYLKRIFECSMKQKNLLLKSNQYISFAYNFSAYPNICDVCGGFGFLSFEIIKKHPKTKITILELEETVKHGRELASFDKIKKTYLQSEQIRFKVGDVFQPNSIPSANLYILMQILRDWNNQDAIRILSSIASSMRKEQMNNNNNNAPLPKLLIIDSIVDETCISPSVYNDNQSLILSDLLTMAIVGGEERTKKQWEFLFKEANLNLIQITKFNLPPYLFLMELTI